MIAGMVQGYPRILFTRQQIAELTGVADSALNYWMREGLLQAAEGGEGRGNHRRFSFTEINIAGILNEVKQFGVGLPALKALANRFHRALDWMHTRGVTFETAQVFTEFALDRESFLEKGYLEIDAAIHQKTFPGSTVEVHGSGPYALARITWEEALQDYILPTILKHEMPNHKEALRIIESVTAEEWQEYRALRSYYYYATLITKRTYESSSLYYFYRDKDDDWVMTPNDAILPVSVIAIDLARLNFNIWSRLA